MHDRRRLRGDEQRGEAAGAPAHHRDARRVGPALGPGGADAGDGVGDVEDAPFVVERVPVAARRSRSSPGSSGAAPPTPATRSTAPAASSRRSLWSVGPPCTSTSSGGQRAVARGRVGVGVGRTPQQPVHRLAVAARPRHRGGLGQVDGVELGGARRGRRAVRGAGARVEHGELGRGAAARADARRRRPRPQSRPACQPLRDVDRRSGRRGRRRTRRPKPSSLRLSTMAAPSGDHANDRWPGPHDGSACSCGSSTSGTGAPPSPAARAHTFIQPSASDDERQRVVGRARTGAGRPRRRRRRRHTARSVRRSRARRT